MYFVQPEHAALVQSGQVFTLAEMLDVWWVKLLPRQGLSAV